MFFINIFDFGFNNFILAVGAEPDIGFIISPTPGINIPANRPENRKVNETVEPKMRI